MSSQLQRRFNTSDEFRKIRPQDEGTGQRNCDAIFARIVLIRLIIFLSSIDVRRIGGPAGNP
jgi:hypothetical protein